jgi:quercetin dioxygenase-like cupin family protein
MKTILLAALAVSALAPSSCTPQAHAAELRRTPLTVAKIAPGKVVDHVPVTRLDFSPGQATGHHQHPMPVVGYVESGTFVVQVQGEQERRYAAGEVIYEPANTTIERYDNASSNEPAVLIASYLAGVEDTALITMLPAK